jgi:hypothetical protein
LSSFLYSLGKEALLDGTCNWKTSALKAYLIDTAQYGLQVTNATNANPIVITTSAAHGLTTGDLVAIGGIVGNTAANNAGAVAVTVLTSTTFSVAIAGNGAYVSGGYVIKADSDKFLSDIASGARVANVVIPTGASRTATKGVCDASDVTFSGVAQGQPTCEAVVITFDTSNPATDRLLIFIDQATSGLPALPNGGDINVAWDNGVYKIFAM